MEFKGMKWVGNVYEKFEAMCLEVEEIIVQDTAKYVENQVHTVGNTVKKFYSDVVQDLLPDEEKTLPVSMLHEYAPVCSFKQKSESYVKQEEEVPTEGKKDGCEMRLRGLDADDYDICTSPRQYSYGGPYRRTRVVRKQMIKKEVPFQVTSPPYIQKKDASSLSLGHGTRVKDDVGDAERPISKEDCLKDDRTANQHGLAMVNSVTIQDTEPRTKNEQSLTVASQDSEIRTVNEQSLKVVSSVKSQVSELKTENKHGHTVVDSVRTKTEHGLMVVNSVRRQDSESRPSVATNLPEDCRKETDEDSTQTSSSSASEILQQISGRPVEESCIIVDRDEFDCVVLDKKENNKHKPYKKIRDAISSRMKPNREKEYKRLARQWYAEDVENGRECGDNTKPVEENRSSDESEWELL